MKYFWLALLVSNLATAQIAKVVKDETYKGTLKFSDWKCIEGVDHNTFPVPARVEFKVKKISDVLTLKDNVKIPTEIVDFSASTDPKTDCRALLKAARDKKNHAVSVQHYIEDAEVKKSSGQIIRQRNERLTIKTDQLEFKGYRTTDLN